MEAADTGMNLAVHCMKVCAEPEAWLVLPMKGTKNTKAAKTIIDLPG
jgi:hypothetical protein